MATLLFCVLIALLPEVSCRGDTYQSDKVPKILYYRMISNATRLFMLSLLSDASLLTFAALLLMATGCTSSKSNPSPEDMLKGVANEYFPDGADIELNKSANHALIMSTSPSVRAPQQNTVQFILYNMETREVVHQDAVIRGTVTWSDDDHLEITQVPGVDRGTGDGLTGYLFNIYTGQKHPRK